MVAQFRSDIHQLTYTVTWEKLPDDYLLPDDPVENTSQPLIAAALRESLELQGRLTSENLVASNLGICATVNNRTTVKAPDWFYAHRVIPLDPPRSRRSYTPRLEGDNPAIVMEFLSETDGGEYSARPFPPYGKLWFYERILQVPIYVIFEPDAGSMEVRQLVQGTYQIQTADAEGRYWIEELGLFLGVWSGTKADRTGYWLRWWDREGKLLPWGMERVEQERQRAEQERQRAEQERQRAERLADYLRSQGLDPEQL
ncbi:MAG: hypothetical protein F6J92_15785 [Symploca sp. SIO1A3]|nr:hypothetical protein [Symploca sp. SIO1A3]